MFYVLDISIDDLHILCGGVMDWPTVYTDTWPYVHSVLHKSVLARSVSSLVRSH